MALTHAATAAPSARALSQAKDSAAEPQLPAHVQTFLGMIQTHFESPQPGSPSYRRWDQHDTRAYGKVVLRLTGAQCRALMDTLRTKHHWRPSVAQVQEALDELTAQINPTAGLTGAEIAARTVVTMPKALPSAANDPGRQQARREAERRRRMLGQESAPVATAIATPSAPASIVGLLAVALVEGRDVRGVVWSQEGDRVQLKLAGGEKLWVDSIHARTEEPKDYSMPNNPSEARV